VVMVKMEGVELASGELVVLHSRAASSVMIGTRA
jgi:hypothetical protein